MDEDALVARLRAAGCVFAEDEAALLLQAAGGAELERMIAARVEGLPLEQVLGWAEFAGLRVAIDPGVFVPRRRTEFMVELAAEILGASPRAAASSSDNALVLDLCCGSGAVGMALKRAQASIRLFASDIEPAAVANARRNLGEDATVLEGDLYAPLPDELQESFDLITCNAPYVPTDDIRLMPPEARLYEPAVTLDGGVDGLDVHRRVIADSRDWLAFGGSLLIEASERQAPITAAEMERHGLSARIRHDDERGGTVVIGRLES